MSIEDRAKATAQNIEGKVQAAVGEITGDPKDKAEGEAKQAQAEATHAREDVKDAMKDAID
ncbi:CsbD family protein [Nodosilinea sp. LEGE 07088]|uniref:CsbD family protein n=1 Tax=Nodosilinea sp. LEGE 07088 TaxID=2777968 RepID=UPI001882C00E|nr:CsbD family protein [Nodosilinea sp. LEGE 07088]MBE9135790.1 CsbD family protein [Nodosilinea sp. LEGE 07088]